MFNRKENGEVNYNTIVSDIYDWACKEVSKKDGKIGVLICEGDENSIDEAVYELVYPNLLVVPVGSCAAVMRLLPKLRRRLSPLNMYAFGIIDRDAYTKAEAKTLFLNRGVYTTRLPFIENIICSPEVLWHVCRYLDLDYYAFLDNVETQLVKILWQKLKETVPISIGIEKQETILHLSIGVSTKKKKITKRVNKDSILYSFRDKVIVIIVANRIGIKSKKDFYNFMISLMKNEEYKEALVNEFGNFLPKLEFYDFSQK